MAFSTVTETIVVLIGLVFVVLLVIQILFLFRVRRSLFQVNQFMKLMNLVLKEMANTHASTLKTALSNEEALKSLNREPIRYSKHKICQNCKHRVSYVLFGTEKLDFRYSCGLSKKDVELSHTCEMFEADAEAASQKN